MISDQSLSEPGPESVNETSASSGSDNDTSGQGHTRFSAEYRNQLVSALKRRLKRQDEPSATDDSQIDDSFNDQYADQNYGNNYGQQRTPSYAQNQENMNINNNRQHSATEMRNSPQKHHQQQQQQEDPYPVLDPFQGRMMSMDEDANVVNARTTRIAQAESAIRQDMFKECTFKPQITKLPKSYGADGNAKDSTPFYQRVMRWQKDKDMEAKRRVEMHRENDVTDCTFKPQINKTSEKVARSNVSKTGLSMTGMPIGSEGGASGGSNIVNPNRKKMSSEESANERLYRSGELSEQAKRQALEETIQMQQEKERMDSEYHIYTTNNSKYHHIAPRVYNGLLDNNPQDENNNAARSRSSTPAKDPSCTFTPKVKGASNSMASAKLYLSANVVDRLTRPMTAEKPKGRNGRGAQGQPTQQAFDDDYVLRNTMANRSTNNSVVSGGGGGVMDVASFMNSLGGNNLPYNTPGARSSNNRPQSAPRERNFDRDNYSLNSSPSASIVSTQSHAEKQAKSQRFKEFLTRQTQSVKRKEHKVLDATRATTPVFKPDLSNRSLNISDTHFKGSFLERLSRDVINRKTKETKQAQTPVKDPNCTFKPQILAKSENLRPRSVYELSRGDAVKRESNQKITKLRNEQEQLAEATFQPVISKYAERSHSKSLLNTNKNPNEFLTHYHKSQDKRQQMRAETTKLREEKELEGCTFKPQTTPCPAYIKRIAKSMQVVKASRKLSAEANEKNQPPSWR